jgi:hypothetical protein
VVRFCGIIRFFCLIPLAVAGIDFLTSPAVTEPLALVPFFPLRYKGFYMPVTFQKMLCLTLVVITPAWGLPCRLVAAQDPIITAQTDRQEKLAANEVEAVPVLLSQDRKLRGVAKTKEGKVAAGATVVLGIDGKPVGRVIADDQGRFEFGPLKPGKYQVATRDAAAMLAVYSVDSDAPAARDAMKMIEVSQPAMIARGQSPGGLLTNPWFIGLIVAAAIAIPLAIVLSDDDDDDAS